MTQPLVSVKMLTYNHAPYIVQAIEGVLMQKTDFPFELVIGEDCSTDGTSQIVFDYARKNPDIIRVITSDENVGMNMNSLRVTEQLRGKYIAWCEGDDYWHRDDKLQLQADYLENHPECGLVFSDFDMYYAKSKETIKSYLKASGDKFVQDPGILEMAERRGGVMTLTVMARKELVEKVKSEDPFLHASGYFKMGDAQLWTEIAACSRLHRINESLATRNLLEESASQSQDPQKSSEFFTSSGEMWIYLCEKHKLPFHIKQQYIEGLRSNSLRLAFYENNLHRAYKIKKEYPAFSLKDYLWYYATVNKTVKQIFSSILFVKKNIIDNLISKFHSRK
jgi:glycosyltransferase involved in cell wall biosynthesis